MDIAAFKVCHSVGIEIDATALRAARARSSSVEAMEHYTWVKGKFKMQAHPCCSIVMDIAAFKVSHSVGCDFNATALRAARAGSSSIGAMKHYTWVRFAGELTSCRTTHTQRSAHTSGAMAGRSGKVQDVSTPHQQCCHGYCSLQSLPLR